MGPKRWQQIEQIYHSVAACPRESRAAALDEHCQGDSELRRELESLLGARDEAGSFLSHEDRCRMAELACEPPAEAVGSALSHYDILAEIGAGAMGVVYRARDTRLDRHVALKILPAHFANDAGRLDRFRREAKAASALNHLNIVTIYDIGECDGTWFIAAELVDGVTLRSRLQSGRLPLAEALGIAIQCAAALQTAHAAGIVHRDIKPENIMIRRDGVVKVVDFGLASVHEGDGVPAVKATASGMVLGTPRYMSPEQARGQKLDSRSDIFSLGAVLYEMATGLPAFPGANIAEIFAALVGGAKPVDVIPVPGARLRRILSKALERDRETRYQTIEEFATDLHAINPSAPVRRHWALSAAVNRRYVALVLALIAVLAVSLLLWMRTRRPLTEDDTVLLAEFENRTGDPVFDATLKDGLAVQLEQSPHLNILPDARVRDTLRLMGRQPDSAITPEIAREICERRGLKATISGSITPIGSHYAITLRATDGRAGDTLAMEQVEAPGKEQVLKALSSAAAGLRRKLGESLTSIQKYDALLERTTSSLEALRAYSLGYQERRRGRQNEAIPFFRQAVELDPNFAYAYADLATIFHNTRRPELAAEHTAKAYALRERVSERERLRITSLYYQLVTGEIDKNIETLKLYRQIYPRDPLPYNNLAVTYTSIGQYELAVEESRAALRLDADSPSRYSVLANALLHLNRYADAKTIAEKALEHNQVNTTIRHILFRIAFVAADASGMERETRSAAGKPIEHSPLAWQAGAAAFQGQWHRSAECARRAIDIAMQGNAREVAALYASEAALRAAVIGNCAEARGAAAQALAIAHSQESLPRAELAMELCGAPAGAESHELMQRYPKHTILMSVWLPVLQAALDLKEGRDASAIERLKPTIAYEAAADFWPQYLRGQAYLRLQMGAESAAEFRKILDHRGQAVESVLYPMARLGLARATALQGDRAQARQSYQALLAEWKDADAETPPLVAARRELEQMK